MTEPVTAYLTHRPWNAANGDELFGGFARVIVHEQPIGLVHRFTQTERASSGVKWGKSHRPAEEGQRELREGTTEVELPGQEPAADLPRSRGWMTLLPVLLLRTTASEKRLVVKLRCRCGEESYTQERNWRDGGRKCPKSCLGCRTAFRKATCAERRAPTETKRAA
jgi:hypothetical protein